VIELRRLSSFSTELAGASGSLIRNSTPTPSRKELLVSDIDLLRDIFWREKSESGGCGATSIIEINSFIHP
jgi:hypothetical protein